MLKIAQVGSIWYNTPPLTYGGTERVVFNLTEELVKKGHDITLFASGSSRTSAKLQSIHPKALFDDGVAGTNSTYPLLHITNALDQAEKFDILHIHISRASEYVAFPLARFLKHKVVFTTHFPYPESPEQIDRHRILQKYKDLNFISISNAQRKGGENLNWTHTVYDGIDITPFVFNADPSNYLCWVGRFTPDKGPLEAIEAAKAAGIKIKMAGNIDTLKDEDREYFEKSIKPHIDGDQVEYTGEVNEKEKSELMGSALALLMPIKWNEPFGLVMAEAMACGTPVIALRNGAAPEIVDDTKTGFIVDTVTEMSERIKEIDSIDRHACRARVEAMFTSEKMADNYIKAYEDIIRSN